MAMAETGWRLNGEAKTGDREAVRSRSGNERSIPLTHIPVRATGGQPFWPKQEAMALLPSKAMGNSCRALAISFRYRPITGRVRVSGSANENTRTASYCTPSA